MTSRLVTIFARSFALSFALSLALSPVLAVDLDSVRAEPNAEKRSERAMKAAESAMDEARKAFRESQSTAEAAALMQLRDAVEISNQSLEQTGKNARRNPKYFKKAEITLRKLIRHLEDFRFAKSAEDREGAEKLLAFLHESQEKMLLGIMTKKK